MKIQTLTLPLICTFIEVLVTQDSLSEECEYVV